MEIAPILMATGSTLFTSVNTYMLRRQSNKLKLLKGRYKVSLDETKKCIREHDRMVEYVYQLYNISTDLHQTLCAMVSLEGTDITNVYSTLKQACVYVGSDMQDMHPTHEWNPSEWNTVKDSMPHYTLVCSTHADVNAFVYLLVQFIHCIEEGKTNKNAIHAFHTGNIQNVTERFRYHLHRHQSALHIPLNMQQRMAQYSQHGNTSSNAFASYLCEWYTLLRAVPTNPFHQSNSSRNTHDTLANLLSAEDQKHTLNHYLLSDFCKEQSFHTSPTSYTSSPNQPATRKTNKTTSETHHEDKHDSPSLICEGLRVIESQGRLRTYITTQHSTIQWLEDIHQRIDPFKATLVQVHHLLQTMYKTRDRFYNHQSQNIRLTLYAWYCSVPSKKKLLFRRKSMTYSSWTDIRAHVREHNWHTYKRHPYYTRLKEQIMCDTYALKQIYNVLKQSYTLPQLIQYIYFMYENKLYEIVVQQQHPKWFQMVRDVHDIVEASSNVIKKDVVFRNALINTT